MRLIDADKLPKYTGYALSADEVAMAVENAPTIDAVEVVRCKDCKYSEHWYKDKRRCFLWNEAGIDVFEDGFCNYAERRADE